jgi:CoA-transferase family III
VIIARIEIMSDEITQITTRIWRAAGDPAGGTERLTITGPRHVLPSVFDVSGLATASVAAATLAAAEFLAARNGTTQRHPTRRHPTQRHPTRRHPTQWSVTVDSRAASAAFAAEALFTPVGWDRPEVWDPIAGNYRASDGWIRLHTNYACHRAAVEKVLHATDADAVAAATKSWKAADLEAAVVDAGGCAAAMHDRDDWLASPYGAATASAPPLMVTERSPLARTNPDPAAPTGRRPEGATAPFAGIRVLDVTRVIAGPVATMFLAAYGADVLRVDPPGFAEVAAILPVTTVGKRTAALDLRSAAGRTAFEGLLATADVLVTGLRADALARLGYDDEALARLNPALIVASHNAYGWNGPWRDRRGFDSLVQMSCGIAAAGAVAAGAVAAETVAAGKDRPVPLPVQALDHATGYLIAAAVGRALARRLTQGTVSRIRASLIGTANLLWSLPRPAGLPPAIDPADFPLVDAQTAWGLARRVPPPGEIVGVTAGWTVDAGPLGRHEPAWAAG